MPYRKGGKTPPLTSLAILVVLGGWVANLAATMVLDDYEANSTVDTILLSVMGFLLAGKVATGPGHALPEDDARPRLEGPEEPPEQGPEEPPQPPPTKGG